MEDVHDFGWALAKMRDGYAVRRQGTPAHWALRLVNETTLVQRNGFEPDCVMLDDILAYDWELAD
jgi:hypothetical protein